MFGINSSYYNQSLKKLVAAFGSIFNQLYIDRYDANQTATNKIRVPISYGPKEKFIRKIIADSGITDNVHVQMTLPMMGFDITSMVYDPTRRVNKLKNVFSETNNTLSSTWTATPYNINFGLYVFSRHIDDNLQILEQILPNFSPDFTVSLNMNSLNSQIDIPIILNAVNMSEDYEGTYEVRRNITSILDFTAKTYLYGRIKQETSNLIEDVDVNMFDGLTAGTATLIEDFGYTGDVGANTITWRI